MSLFGEHFVDLHLMTCRSMWPETLLQVRRGEDLGIAAYEDGEFIIVHRIGDHPKERYRRAAEAIADGWRVEMPRWVDTDA